MSLLHQNFIESARKLCYNITAESNGPVGKRVNLKTIDWDSLTFVNNYVFQEVLKNKKLCKYLIERILHIHIKDIRYLIAERHISSARISSKSIRLDVYVENQEAPF